MKPLARILAVTLPLLSATCSVEDWKNAGAIIGGAADSTFQIYDGYKVRQDPKYYQQPAVIRQPVTAYPWPTYAPQSY